ncbi:helix-turn-helix domain-containing protein [Paenibacillus sp. OK003]|uniref:helix-turn-helix domain-containing protein n=1 Tax=Paenibacillus sp. OK003 TaxID=1884380 RepID=UPI0008C48CBD|nr:helix-turn-helix transcriptional regulator [Paenibacillus sp. OK003]SEL79631.1 DNA-binding transcriptional regulator, XRE-family HTH domain [Paenibacillus sp. OK003]
MSELRQLIGTRIRAMRNAKGLTQQKLADIAGLDYRYIGALERGERNFSIDTLEKVLLALNVSISELMVLEDIENNKLQKEAIDILIALISTLNNEQVDIVVRITKEISRAFKSTNR